MICFVHMDFDPIPKEVKSPSAAISLAEAVLKAEQEEEPDSKYQIFWRRNDFYPDNFFEYTLEQLQKELIESGSIVLQLANLSGDFPVMGGSVTILTESLEKKYALEADSALEDADEELDQKNLDLHGESQLKSRKKIKKN